MSDGMQQYNDGYSWNIEVIFKVVCKRINKHLHQILTKNLFVNMYTFVKEFPWPISYNHTIV